MMEAVARGKAHWLFGASSNGLFNGKRRPQEDMVTSAVFGSILLMSPEDRRRALEIILGRECFEAVGFSGNADIDISLWPRLEGLEGRRYVEPDALLFCAGKTVIVEVKWHASLSDCQIEQQIEVAVKRLTGHIVTAVVLLGEAGVEDEVFGMPCFRRTWRDVSGELQLWTSKANSSLERWVKTMSAFLQKTDMGRVFEGLSTLTDSDNAIFQFKRAGRTPWLNSAPSAVEPVHYNFKVKQ